eukprot:CAMPEP_0194544292 /NCGR_PEP_ID=MMETSP0253-20130528/87310_1 /TAXON_ID=2966 /ORGANISM="Noctiluca scintillans" /LENGTH=152 /DNA_ID=CAMNT_0039391161 /DNA_START=283 /DNA_END=740 /DNA_ORIENTATION=+
MTLTTLSPSSTVKALAVMARLHGEHDTNGLFTIVLSRRSGFQRSKPVDTKPAAIFSLLVEGHRCRLKRGERQRVVDVSAARAHHPFTFDEVVRDPRRRKQRARIFLVECLAQKVLQPPLACLLLLLNQYRQSAHVRETRLGRDEAITFAQPV